MAKSLGLAAYRALSRRNQAGLAQWQFPPRPTGELVWMHATDHMRFDALGDIAARMRQQRPDIHVLVTFDRVAMEHPSPDGSPDGVDWVFGLESDHPSGGRPFIDHWLPDVCLWAGGRFMINLVNCASEHGIPMILCDVSEADMQPHRRSWIPTLARTTLDFFDKIVVNNDSTLHAIRRLGITADKLSVAPRLRPSALPPDCLSQDLDDVMNDLGGRPVWLGVKVLGSEIDMVLTAHRTAMRLAHRLLLILTLADRSDMEVLKAKVTARQLRYADWDRGDPIEDNVQIIICSDTADLGLWYRVAPLAFLACSLEKDARGISPLDAAALGSAIIYGPNVSAHIDSYSRLSAAGAARTVNDGESLAAALIHLIAPDHSAAMALAGWEVVTESAALTDGLIEQIIDGLDQKAAAHARP